MSSPSVIPDGVTVTRPRAGLVRIHGALWAAPSPRSQAVVVVGTQAVGHCVAFAGEDGIVEFLVDPETAFHVKIATDDPNNPHAVDRPADEPPSLENLPRRSAHAIAVPIERRHRIENAVRLTLDGQTRLANEAATFHEITQANALINGDPHR